ncbi:hypothetical protein CYY_000798 [Polysphondylium violaceum]|uniref:Uncharacterized protein n=1 Tax=Polysphondylium violaceum TaxID=133409 RepID=A0A8J4Q390_9MYCE|nr:hypothetical protein CYY_000798 [Polysphondylium violaceum]
MGDSSEKSYTRYTKLYIDYVTVNDLDHNDATICSFLKHIRPNYAHGTLTIILRKVKELYDKELKIEYGDLGEATEFLSGIKKKKKSSSKSKSSSTTIPKVAKTQGNVAQISSVVNKKAR